MKLYPILRCISLIAYCVIWLRGSMIGVPFIFFLLYAVFDWSIWTQAAAALLAFVGLITLSVFSVTDRRDRPLLPEILIFIILVLPIVERLIAVPIYLFNYPAFIIPCLTFVVLHPASIFFLHRGQHPKKISYIIHPYNE